jgi:hypothetical protein
MRTLALLLVLLMVGGLAWARAAGDREEKSTTHWILTASQKDPRSGASCSATAVAADTIRTARHCVDRMRLIAIDGERVEPYGTRMLPGDVAEVVMTQELFEHWATIGPPPQQGDRLHWWGNPRWIKPGSFLIDVYREAIVAKVWDGKVLMDAAVCHGDSGSGLFNEAGQLVGVVVAMAPEPSKCTFAMGQL